MNRTETVLVLNGKLEGRYAVVADISDMGIIVECGGQWDVVQEGDLKEIERGVFYGVHD